MAAEGDKARLGHDVVHHAHVVAEVAEHRAEAFRRVDVVVHDEYPARQELFRARVQPLGT
jgi:hypothetical protein